MHVSDEWHSCHFLWGNNSAESYHLYSPPEYPIPRYTKNEICEEGYLDYFRVTCPKIGIDCATITHLQIDIDRGVTSFKTFGNMLKSLLPKLKTLDVDQNFSYHPLLNEKEQDITRVEYDDFLYMLKNLQLDNFRLRDEQSRFFKWLSLDDIFEVMPEDSLFVLRHNACTNPDALLFLLTQNELKKYYEKRGSKEIYLYG
jgi:hypothetical protein